jgi:hypothetical protein
LNVLPVTLSEASVEEEHGVALAGAFGVELLGGDTGFLVCYREAGWRGWGWEPESLHGCELGDKIKRIFVDRTLGRAVVGRVRIIIDKPLPIILIHLRLRLTIPVQHRTNHHTTPINHSPSILAQS